MSKTYIPSTTSDRRAYAKNLIGVGMSNYEIQKNVKNRYGIKIASNHLNLLRAGILPLKSKVEVRKIGIKRNRTGATLQTTQKAPENKQVFAHMLPPIEQLTPPPAPKNAVSEVLLAAKLVGAKSVTIGDVTVNL